MQFFATCPRGMEELVAGELAPLDGVVRAEPRRGGVAFEGSLASAYAACLWSRVANRVLLPLARFPAADGDALYDGVRTIRWREHLDVRHTLAVAFTQIGSQLTHTQFGAQKTKDAIVDQLRDETGARPSVDRTQPDVRVHVHVENDVAEVGIDLSGESLHKRGWRTPGAPAPLKENLAAAILLLADWPRRAREGMPFLDAMCGSGTLPIEAALMATDRAPGLHRSRFGFHGWKGHDATAWKQLLDAARARVIDDPAKVPPIFGCDEDPRAIALAQKNLERARLERFVTLEQRALADQAAPVDQTGLFVINPPYGERLGDVEALAPLYALVGDVLKRRFPGWTAFVFTGNRELAKDLGLKAARRHVLWNGPIECRLYELPLSATPPVDEAGPAWRRPRAASPAAEAFKNRVLKNWKHLRKWATREGVTCWRVYDADLPEYAVAVDLYEDALHVQEYDPPKTVDPVKATERLNDVLAVLPDALSVAPGDVFLKVRRRQRGLRQYEKLGDRRVEREVREGGHRFWVNLSDYLDTGLFLDHRKLRKMIEEMARGKRFLNLFSYTGSATVYAAKGGAKSSVSVDLSNTYLDWAARNFALNGVAERAHRLERGDVSAWLERARDTFDLVFIAPPTFSRSKAMEDTFDVQRDHVALLRATARLLAPGGTILFSNHFRRFKMDAAALAGFRVEEITYKTVPEDFKGNPRIHNSWRITRE